MHTRPLLVAATLSVILPQAVPAQTTESLQEYARSVYAAELGAGYQQPLPESMADTGAGSRTSLPRALAKVRPPSGYERLHATLVRNARLIASGGNQSPIAGNDPCAGATAGAIENCNSANTPVPESADQRLNAAYHQYGAARERLARRLKSAGVSLQRFPGHAIGR